jgi:hypothetical protein
MEKFKLFRCQRVDFNALPCWEDKKVEIYNVIFPNFDMCMEELERIVHSTYDEDKQLLD